MPPFKKFSGLHPQPRWGAQRPPDLHLQSTSIHRWLRPCLSGTSHGMAGRRNFKRRSTLGRRETSFHCAFIRRCTCSPTKWTKSETSWRSHRSGLSRTAARSSTRYIGACTLTCTYQQTRRETRFFVTRGETNRSNIRIKVFVQRCSNFVSLFELFVPLAHAQNNLRSIKKPVLAMDESSASSSSVRKHFEKNKGAGTVTCKLCQNVEQVEVERE